MLRRQQVDLESAEFDLSHDAATGGVMLQSIIYFVARLSKLVHPVAKNC